MKVIATRDQTMLESGGLTIADIWKVTRRDGQVFTFTEHDQDIEFGGLTYDASTAFNRTAKADSDTLAPSNMVMETFLDSEVIQESDVIAGLWDYAAFEVRTVNWHDRRVLHISAVTKANPGVVTTREPHGLTSGDTVTITGVGGMTELNGNTYTVTVISTTTFSIGTNTTSYTTYLAQGEVRIPETSWNYRNGRFGQLEMDGQIVRTELMGLGKQLEKNLLRPYLPSCPAALGDSECQVNLASFTHTGTLDAVDATGLQLTDAELVQADAYFDYGLITMTSGASSGYSMEVKSYTTGVLVLQQPLPFGISAGDTYSIRAGCDKTKATCGSKFNNVINFQGFPDMPGMDRVLGYGN
jgi:hypothetical protein